MVFGMSTACFFGHLLTEEAVAKLSQLGVSHAEIFLCCASEYKPGYIKELKKRLLDGGVSACSVHALSVQFEPQLFTSYQRAKADAFAVFQEVVEAASILEAKSYTFHGLTNLKRIKNPILDYKVIAERVSELADYSARFGVMLAWENVHWCLFNDTAFLKNLLECGVSDNLKFTLDLKQSVQAGVDPEDFLRCVGARLANVHICDYEEYGGHIRTRLPFEGKLDFPGLKAAMKDIGYDGPLIYEVYAHDYKSEEQLAENYRRTRDFFTA